MSNQDQRRAWLRDADICDRFGISLDTLMTWRRTLAFPAAVKFSAGSPNRTSLTRIEAWEQARERKRHRPIHRGAIARMMRKGTGAEGGGNG